MTWSELGVAHLEVGEEPDLLEDLVGQVLGLVHDDQRGRKPGLELASRTRSCRLWIICTRLRLVAGHLQLVEDHPQELFAVDRGVGDEHRANRHVEPLEQRPQEGRLAGPDLAHQADEAPALLDAVDERGQGLAVAAARVEEPRVRRDREGLHLEAEVGFVHGAQLVLPRLAWSGMAPRSGIPTRASRSRPVVSEWSKYSDDEGEAEPPDGPEQQPQQEVQGLARPHRPQGPLRGLGDADVHDLLLVHRRRDARLLVLLLVEHVGVLGGPRLAAQPLGGEALLVELLERPPVARHLRLQRVVPRASAPQVRLRGEEERLRGPG